MRLELAVRTRFRAIRADPGDFLTAIDGDTLANGVQRRERNVKGQIRKKQRGQVPFFRNPGFWIVFIGVALIIDMAHRTNFLAVGTRMRYLTEPDMGFARGLEGWIGAACVFAGVWFYVARSKRDPSE